MLRFGINAILIPGINLADFFPFLKPLELTEIDIYLSEYYLAVEAFPKIDDESKKLLLGMLTNDYVSELLNKNLFENLSLVQNFKDILAETYDETTFEDAKKYLQHSNLQGPKAIYKISKLFEDLLHLRDPSHKSTPIDDL